MLATFRGINPAALHALEIEFGVNVHQNLIVSYFQYLGNCLTGQFGLTAQGVPVMTEITSKLPWTLGARRRDDGHRVRDRHARRHGRAPGGGAAGSTGSCRRCCSSSRPFPVFFVGLLLLYVFAVKLNWLPLSSQLQHRRDADVVAVVHLGRAQARACCPGSAW